VRNEERGPGGTNDRATIEGADDSLNCQQKKEKRNVQKTVDLTDNALCGLMLEGSEREERLPDRRRKRWSAAPFK